MYVGLVERGSRVGFRKVKNPAIHRGIVGNGEVEDAEDLGEALESGCEGDGEGGLACAAAAAARTDNTKMARKIRFMLDLITLDLILLDLTLLDLNLIRTSLPELRALPGSTISWMQNRRG